VKIEEASSPLYSWSERRAEIRTNVKPLAFEELDIPLKAAQQAMLDRGDSLSCSCPVSLPALSLTGIDPPVLTGTDPGVESALAAR
jgi:hypothetical protein